MAREISKNEFKRMALDRIEILWAAMQEKGHLLKEESPGNYFFTKDGVIVGEFSILKYEVEVKGKIETREKEVPVTLTEKELSLWMGESLINQAEGE